MNIEKHVFDDINFFPDKMKTLILGTFPVPLYSNIEKFEKLTVEEKNNAWYYSSRRSEFWKIIADCFDIDYKNADDFLFNKSKKKKLFEENKIGIADVFSKCKRKNENSARDTDLIILEYNNILKNLITDENNYKDLKLIIFTSRFTENNFFKIINDVEYNIEKSNEVNEYYNNGINEKGISIDIINALKERYLHTNASRKIKLSTITLKISPIKGVSLYSTKKELYKYYLNNTKINHKHTKN
ncbi:uracil-DNA glycosylase family protein [Brachyspira hyodysenteriae]|uniref:uracil-DNA glycosylase family protein n=1 Tax=Brachyspira hyodysenteriae TaxID=159 RepID=UPI002B259A14|nr:uracil-DNA glycosylase family protein [Brachyspira hyodysenteriae]WPC22917.1 uracil-DNA glycosylase family protein [Brachyspira hyodysenteriae]